MRARWTSKSTVGALVATVLVAHASAACSIASPTYLVDGRSDAGAPVATPQALSGPQCAGGFVKVDTSRLPACGNGLGHCYARAGVPFADQLTPCGGDDVCVPDEILTAGGAKLTSCTTAFGAGACVTVKLIPALEQQAGSMLKPDVCAPTQLCVPCVNPTDNSPTPFCMPAGVHDGSCAAAPSGDAGPGPYGSHAPGAATCCSRNGRASGMCVPTTSLPGLVQPFALQETCQSGLSCIPEDFIKNTPRTCNAGADGPGVCMHSCFATSLMYGEMLGMTVQDWACRPGEICAPCSRALAPVPGCQ
jgi:hypothetical protein